MTVEWTDKYPSAEALRREVAAMVGTWVEVLLDRIPQSEITGIYLKGSAQKSWDSPVDYVPELSDVDIHVLFSGRGVFKQIAGSIDSALAMQAQVEERYAKKIGSPIHVPRPQIIELNILMQEPDYCSTPIAAVTKLYGDEYPETGYENEERLRETARKRLASYAEVIEELPFSAFDKPGNYMVALHRRMSWRVSPIGPILLLLRGMPWSQVWLPNRTQIISSLREHGEAEFAADYFRYYLSAWDYFLSGYTDSAAARDMVAATTEVLKRARQVAQGQEPVS